ncbi:MAG: TRAP transporter small permease subunit [Spirochaetia bacterium]|jgi:TRAP-type mannitol/chloroaromatic compound transport system permease small subunit|nr:TRAP transporter small permease subunit [Spirochaetia bacterium]
MGKMFIGEDWAPAKKLVAGINTLSEGTGQFVKFLVMALVLVLFIEVTARYVFDSPTVWALETSKMLLGSIGTLGWGYTHKLGGHVRVDVVYGMLSRRIQALIDVILSIIFLFPLVYVLIFTGSKWALRAWKTGEKMIDSSWLPPAAPFRTLMVVGFCFFALQCIAQFIEDLYYLIYKKELRNV